MVTVEFSLDNAKLNFADLFGTLFRLIRAFDWSKNAISINFLSQPFPE